MVKNMVKNFILDDIIMLMRAIVNMGNNIYIRREIIYEKRKVKYYLSR